MYSEINTFLKFTCELRSHNAWHYFKESWTVTEVSTNYASKLY